MASIETAKSDGWILFAVWVALIGLTLGSFWLADSPTASSSATIWVITIATFKGHLIAGLFMEMRRGPVIWATVMSGFLVFEAALIMLLLSGAG